MTIYERLALEIFRNETHLCSPRLAAGYLSVFILLHPPPTWAGAEFRFFSVHALLEGGDNQDLVSGVADIAFAAQQAFVGNHGPWNLLGTQ